ncbi:hypothetical protein PVK06_002933 [Gossypium arboreum]|uniref:Uncharacterized protein n=1 Tax=Gossypium arboreum TaxID=29729 RepID=A0ABR0R689_GOSAR|nr:hypothetical protein PVK06_002933 [Gossypium arboreum]
MKHSTSRSNSRDKCAFHNDVGHKIEDCFTLKDVITEIVRNGKLAEFVDQGVFQQGQSLHGDPKEAFQKMGLKEKALKKASPLYSFTNHPAEVKGSITLPVTLRDDEHTTTKYVQFFVVDHPMAYDVIFGRPIIRMERMIIATLCMKIKFPTKTRVGYM